LVNLTHTHRRIVDFLISAHERLTYPDGANPSGLVFN
jgi:hypothetical protein